MSERVGQILTDVVVALAFGFIAVRSIRRAEDPARTAFKWALTLIIAGFVWWQAAPLAGQGGQASFSAISLSMAGGLALFIIWRRSIGEIVAKPFSSLYDGGEIEPEPRPFYSIAKARQKQGKYSEAIDEVRRQLAKFPTDLEGQMLIAQIQAEDLKDLPAAESTVQFLCAQPGHCAKNVAFALYSLADWHLKYHQDTVAAQRAFEQLISMFPGTEFALNAAQRIAHLSDPELAQAEASRKFFVTEHVRNLGLAKNPTSLAPPETDPGKLAAEYVKHLEKHPLDTDIRERLAVIYTDHFQRLDLAADELDQMVQMPNQPGRLVVRWLNLLADLQIRSGMDFETVKQTLQRIIDLDPNLAAAETARKRIALLKLELKAKQQNQAVKLGTYEQNLGLKQVRGSPLPPG